jgi:hypothetical protein
MGMELEQTYSITPPQQKELYTPEHLESLALQFSMAQGDMSESAMELNRLRLRNGDEELMKSELVQKANQGNKQISSNIFNTALEQGNVDLAEGVVRGGVPQETPDMVVPNFAADYAAAIKDSDVSRVTTPEDLGLDTQKNARLLAFNNALNEVLSEYDRAYGQDEEEIQQFAQTMAIAGGTLLPMGAPFAVAAQPKAARMTKDMLMFFVNSIYSFSKSGISLSFFFPGSQSKITSNELFDPSISDEEFNNRLNVVRENVRNYYLSDDFKNNPLAAQTLLIDSIGTGQLDNPEFKELADIKTFIDAAGKEQENLLGKVIDPNSKLTGFFMEPTVQNILDNPILDIPFALAGIDLIKTVFGSSTASRILANQIQTGKVTAANWRYLSQMNYPGGIQDSELLSSVQRSMNSIGGGLERSVEALRVEATPMQIAAEQAKIQRTEFSGKDLAYFEYLPEQNNQFIGVNLQARSGNPFFTEASARQAATARGFTDFQVVPNARGNGYLIQLKRSIDESKLMDPVIPDDANFIRTLFGLGKFGYSPNVTGTRSQRFGGGGAPLNVAGYMKLYDPLIEKFSKLTTQEGKSLAGVILKGMRTPHPNDPSGRTLGKWFETESEIDKAFIDTVQRPATFAEKDAYYAYRMAYDLDYVLMNKAKYDKLASDGVNHYNFTGLQNLSDPILGKVVENTGAIADDAKFLLANGRVVDKAGAKAAIDNSDNITVSVYGRMTWGDNEITHIVHNRNNVSSSGLNKFVLGYTEGGARRYAEPFLVKQDGIDGNVITHAIFPSQKKAIEYANRMDTVAKEFRDYKTAVQRLGPNSNAQAINALRRQYDAAIQAAHDGYTLQRVEDEVLRGKFNPDTKFVHLFDGESIPRQGIIGDPNLQSYQYKGGLYYSPRGEHLTSGYIEDYADLISPFEALSEQMTHASRMAGFTDFAIKEINSWMAKYGNYIELDKNIRFPSAEQMFRDGTWRKSIDLSLAQKEMAEAQRMHILRELGHTDTLGAKIVEVKTSLAKEMAISLGDSAFAKWIPNAVRRGTIVTDTDAVNFLKAWNYLFAMGLFYPAQFLLQLSSSALVAARGGLNGIPALKDTPFILMASAGDFNNRVVKLLDTEASLALGYKKGDFTKMLYDWQRTNLKEIGMTEGTKDTITSIDSMAGPIKRIFKGTNELGLLPVYKGEEFVNAASFGVARREAIDLAKKGQFKLGSDEYIYWIRGRANELQGNVRSGNSFWWQKNDATSLMMQMLNWSWKQAEGLLFLDRSMSTAERLRFIVASIGLWGANGFPGGTAIADYYYKNAFKKADETGEEPPSEEELKNAYQGGLDSFFRNVMDIDSAFSARMGNGTLFTTLYTDFLDTKQSILGVFGGISTSKIVEVYEIFPYVGEVLAVAKLRQAQSGQVDMGAIFDAGDLIFSRVASLSSGWNTATKAYMASKLGFEVNRKKNAISSYNAESYPNFLRWMGIPTADEQLAFRTDMWKKNKDQMSWDYANAVVEESIRYQSALQDKDISSMRTSEMAMELLWSTIPKELAGEVDSKAASIMRNPTTQKRLEEAVQQGFVTQ